MHMKNSRKIPVMYLPLAHKIYSFETKEIIANNKLLAKENLTSKADIDGNHLQPKSTKVSIPMTN